jgi:hypothetical protein
VAVLECSVWGSKQCLRDFNVFVLVPTDAISNSLTTGSLAQVKVAEEAWAITFDVPMIREPNRPGYLDWQSAFTPDFAVGSKSLKNLTSCHLSMPRTAEPIKLTTEEVCTTDIYGKTTLVT